jgi:hypothetical protein
MMSFYTISIMMLSFTQAQVFGLIDVDRDAIIEAFRSEDATPRTQLARSSDKEAKARAASVMTNLIEEGLSTTTRLGPCDAST